MELRTDSNTLLQNKNLIMFVITFSFILGVIAFFNGYELIIATLLTITVIILLSTGFIPRKFAIITLIMFYFGFFNSHLRIKTFDELSLIAPNEVTLSGQIVSIPEINGQTAKFQLQVNSPKGKTLVWINDKQHRFENFKLGNHIQVTGKLRTPQKISNPSQFDYARFLQNKQIYSTLYTNIDDCKFLDTKLSPKWKFLQNLNKLRTKIIKTHSKLLKSPNLEILGGIVFGDDAVTPPQHIKTSFINSGLLHILAASGMNVAFIWGFWFFFMQKLRISYRTTLISGILLIILYTLMTGLGASVVRAALMLTFVLIGKLFDRDTHSVSLLSFVALLMLLYNPAYLNDIGFQMSFLATLGILTTGQTIHERLKDIKLPEFLKGDVTIPIVAQAWIAPTQMFYFNTFAPFSIFANIAIIPFLCVISFGGFISSILAIFYPISKYLCLLLNSIINLFITIVVNISNFFATLPNSLITTSKPTIIGIILYYALICTITFIIKNGISTKTKFITFALISLIGISTIHIPNQNLEIIAFDVQNADCFLIKTPDNQYYIIDSGKFTYRSPNPQAAYTIGKYLKDNGIRKIKSLIITHFDNDHAGGGAYLIENFKIEKVYINTTSQKNITASNLFHAMDITTTPYEIAQNKTTINTKTLQIKFLRSEIQNDDNENSIQTLITYKDFNILFTGDAGTKAFTKLKNDLPNNIDILKVGHHGAMHVTNQEMLEILSPKIAIISTGPNNFGHPSKETLENLSSQNIKIFRTDYDNAIKISTNGKIIHTYTFNSKHNKFTKNQTFSAFD